MIPPAAAIVRRCLALAFALAAALGPSTTALAHGHAHEHLAEAHEAAHGDDHGVDHGVDHGDDHAPVSTDGPTIAAPHDADAHAHAGVDSALTARADLRVDSIGVALAAAPLALPTVELEQVATVLRLTTAPPRAGPTTSAPPPSRAPPLA